MMAAIRQFQRWLRHYAYRMLTAPDELDRLKMLMGNVLINQIAARGELNDIREAEVKVFSQFGEDGILQYLIRQTRLPRALDSFVEFGVETYEEANTLFLLRNNNWRGLVIDGSQANVDKLIDSPIYWCHDLQARAAFIDVDNINRLIAEGGYHGEIGILSVDIDGNDYWVWDRIDVVSPVIVIAEYNSVFGPDHAVTIPYDPGFVRGKAHASHLYWGCSLAALDRVARRKGYALVGSNSAGCNAFFVRRDCLNGLRELAVAEAYVASRYRESRDAGGRLTFLRGRDRLAAIQHLSVYDVDNDRPVAIRDLAK